MTAIHWKSAISGPFTTAADWIPGQVPAAGDDVFITAPGTYAVTSSASRTIKTLTTVSTATLAIARGTFTITDSAGSSSNAGTIAVADAAALAVGGQFKNAGEITLNATTHKAGLAIIGNTTLSGLGKVTLSRERQQPHRQQWLRGQAGQRVHDRRRGHHWRPASDAGQPGHHRRRQRDRGAYARHEWVALAAARRTMP